MEDYLTISIKQNTNLATVITNRCDGTAEQRKVNLLELTNALNATYKQELNGELLGAFPNGYLESRYNCPGNFSIWISLPQEKYTLMYYGKPYHIPFPSLLFYFKVVNTNVVKSYLYAVKDKAAPGIMLYHYPFGNVYADGHICWGNTQLPHITTLKDTERLIEIFFMSDTNDDLFDSSRKKTQRQLLHSLKEQFPVSELIQTGKKLSYETFGGKLYGSI